MKKLIVLLLFCIPIVGFSQNAFRGFFRPVPDNLIEMRYSVGTMTVTPGAFLFRATVSVTALQIMLDKEKTVNNLTSAGTGLSYNHYINQNGLPYSDYGFNLLLLYNYEIGGTEPLSLSVAASVTAFQIVNAGIGYDPGLKKGFLLTGISYSFN
jgi:hypothetical protein